MDWTADSPQTVAITTTHSSATTCKQPAQSSLLTLAAKDPNGRDVQLCAVRCGQESSRAQSRSVTAIHGRAHAEPPIGRPTGRTGSTVMSADLVCLRAPPVLLDAAGNHAAELTPRLRAGPDAGASQDRVGSSGEVRAVFADHGLAPSAWPPSPRGHGRSPGRSTPRRDAERSRDALAPGTVG
jgi:hypothetical protein